MVTSASLKTCRACATDPSEEHAQVHALMGAVIDTVTDVAHRRVEVTGEPTNIDVVIGALLSVLASYIDGMFKDHPAQRRRELERCEAYFRAEYLS